MARDGKTTYDDGFKTCKACGERQPIDNFYRHKDARRKSGFTLSARCKKCERDSVKKLRYGGDLHYLKYGHEKNSLMDQATPEEMRAILRRERDYIAQCAEIEDWASAGFVSGYVVLTD